MLCESPRCVLIDTTSPGTSSDDVIRWLIEWRIAGPIRQDVSYCVWRAAADGRMSIETGVIDTEAIAEIQNVDPRFGTAACLALLRALEIWVDPSNIKVTDAYDSCGTASRTLRATVSKSDIDRLAGIPRRFVWDGQRLKVTSHKVVDAMGRSAVAKPKQQASPSMGVLSSPRSAHITKRSHVSTSTPN